jgi:hypothetical protein
MTLGPRWLNQPRRRHVAGACHTPDHGAMSYITSKKTFPVAMIGFPLTEKAIKDRRSVMFVYDEGDETFRVRAHEFEYQEIMHDLKLAHEAFEASRALHKPAK